MKPWFTRHKETAADDSLKNEKVLQLLEELNSFAIRQSNLEELKIGREFYFGKTGQVFEDDPDFEHRMNSFLEWLIFDHKSGGAETSTVFEKFVDSKRESLTNEEMVFLMNVGKHIHSIFQVRSCDDGRIKVKDLLGGKVYQLPSEDKLEKGDLLERRLLCLGDCCCFFHTYSLHPKLAYKPIMAELKKRKKSGIKPDFFISLQAMHVKWRRSRQIKVRDIYKF
ncbi:MAG: hypothetical protein ACE5EN_01010 [Nitrospinota bacterium]